MDAEHTISSYPFPLAHLTPPPYLLAVLQNSFLGSDAALGTTRIRLPFSTLDVDMHVELPTEHGHLRLGQQSHRVI